MRSSLVAASVAVISLAVVGCQPKSTAPPASAEMSSDMRVTAIEQAAQLQAKYDRDVSGAKVGAVTEVKIIEGTTFIAADMTGVPQDALALVVDSNEQQVGLVKAFNAGNGQTFFEVIDSSRPITPGDFVVRFPEGTAVELQPVGGPST